MKHQELFLKVEQEARERVIVQRDLLDNEEVLEDVKVVRRELEGYSARIGARRMTRFP